MALIQYKPKDLIPEIRIYSDLRNNSFLTDEEIVNIIDRVCEKLYKSACQLKSGIYLREIDDLVPVDAKILLPDDFFMLRLLEQKYAQNNYFPLKERSLAEASSLDDHFSVNYYGPVMWGFVMFDDHIRIYPHDSANAVRYRLHYSKEIDFNDAKIRDSFNSYLIFQTAYLAGVIQQNPNDRLKIEADDWEKKIMGWLSVRNSSPKTIKDTYSAYNRGYF